MIVQLVSGNLSFASCEMPSFANRGRRAHCRATATGLWVPVSSPGVKNPARQGRRGRFHPWVGKIPEEEPATHFSTLAWRTPRTEEPGGLQSLGPQRVRRDWAHTHSQIRGGPFSLASFFITARPCAPCPLWAVLNLSHGESPLVLSWVFQCPLSL